MGNIVMKSEDATDLRRLPEGRGTSDESCIIGVLKSVRCCGMGLERLTGGG